MRVPEFVERGKSIAYKSTCFQKKFIAKNLEQALSIIEAQREALEAMIAASSNYQNYLTPHPAILQARRALDMDV